MPFRLQLALESGKELVLHLIIDQGKVAQLNDIKFTKWRHDIRRNRKKTEHHIVTLSVYCRNAVLIRLGVIMLRAVLLSVFLISVCRHGEFRNAKCRYA